MFIGGQNSSLNPSELPPSYYSRGMNVVNRGGIIQCRPGYRCRVLFPPGRLQGLFVFKPKQGAEIILVAVAGKIYKVESPYISSTEILGIQFSETAREIFFEQVEQSLELNPDGSLTFITPKNLIVIQDGALTAPAVFDGTTAQHVRGANAIPLGGPMKWIGDRLWVARGVQLFASDLANPVAFTETDYIASVNAFIFSREITALARTPSESFPQLVVFTETTTSLIQAGIRNRTLWLSTENFQKEIFPRVGSVSMRSITQKNGFLWWYSLEGLTSMDAAAQAFVTSTISYRDEEMTDSKSRLSLDLSGVACAAFENYLLVSVPYADKFNKHTWVLDSSVLPFVENSKPAWNSVWTGTRPVAWVSDSFNGESRIFFISVDYDGANRLWEAFTPDRLDDGCPITWWAELRGLNFQTPGLYKEFRYADVYLSELLGTVDVAVFWAGAHRGKYKRIMTKRIRASRGTIRMDKNLKAGEKIFALKKQTRHTRTQDGRAIIADELLSSCDVEDQYEEFKDDSFQLLVVGSGPGAIRGCLAYAEPPVNDNDSGRCEIDETEENFVRFDGAASEDKQYENALNNFAEEIPLFFSVQTETVSSGGLTEIGTAPAQSVISQADADKIARTIARRIASKRLEAILPSTASQGILINTL